MQSFRCIPKFACVALVSGLGFCLTAIYKKFGRPATKEEAKEANWTLFKPGGKRKR